MARRLFYLAFLCTLVLFLTGISSATQITLGESTMGLLVFTNEGGHTVDLTFSGNCGYGPNDCLSGYGLLGTNLGVYKMWMLGGPPLMMPPILFDIYDWDMNGTTINFAMTLYGGKGTILGTIRLECLSGATTVAPTILAEFTASSTTGLFNGLWPIGVEVPDDFTISLHNTEDVDLVYLGMVASTKGPLSSGEILTTPEPGTLGLLGSSLFTIAGLLKRRWNR